MCLLIMLNNFMSMSVVRSDLTNQVSDKNILVMTFKTTQYTCVGLYTMNNIYFINDTARKYVYLFYLNRLIQKHAGLVCIPQCEFHFKM